MSQVLIYYLFLIISAGFGLYVFLTADLNAYKERNVKAVQEQTTQELRSGSFDRPEGQSW